MLQLKVVVWKNLLIRKRHWILTLFESVLPVLLFFLIAYGRSKITGLHKTEINETTYNAVDPILYNTLSVDETYLYYSPNNEFYQDVIKRIQIKFHMYNNNIKGFDSKEALIQYYATHHNDTVIAIVFHGNNPKRLDYTIRYHFGGYNGDINTNEMYNNKFQFTPGIGTEYYWKGFLSIQKAVDMSFIEKSYGKDLEDNITLAIREFPYPPHRSDSAISTVFLTYLPLITVFSFIFLCPAVLKSVVEEKYSGFKELLKMVGMKSWMLWLGWFIYGMLPMIFSITCIVILMKVPFFDTEYPPIEYSDGFVLFVFLLLYCMASIVFCFAISSLFNKPTIAVVVGMLIWILSYFVPKYSFGLEETNNKLSWSLSMLLNLFPNMALHYGYAAISVYEEREMGIKWSNFYKSSSGGADDVTMLNVFVMLVVDMLIYVSFTFYMDGINPGKYGVRKSCFFPFVSLKKLVKRSIGKWEIEEDAESVRLDNVEEGRGMKKGIEVQHLCKRFGHKQAVNNLSLDIYQNQITVLLGHNGAGKSTTMSMITGMIDITSGSVKMNGKNVKQNMDEIRKNLGLCPQHNLLFSDLTVGEHLQFFARLKGRTSKEAADETRKILKMLNLTDKKNAMANTLSGGMKRKLCLGMAIIGGSNILILDEPTSGMDPESRRELWDMLLLWRGEKTILITTHFMEEADVLGDWIAIMANGALQCYGTPMFLKRKYDTGYHLSLMVKDDITDEQKENIKKNIINYIDDAQFKDLNGKNMVFVLPFDDNIKISNLLSFLEEKKDDLQIENISITVTTLEDVFLKAKMETEPENYKTETSDLQETESISQKQQKLRILRMITLIRKKLQFYQKKIYTYIIPAIIASIFFILTIYLSNNASEYYGDNGPEIKLKLGAYKQSTAFYNSTGGEFGGKIKTFYKQLIESNKGIATEAKDVEQAIVDKGVENIAYYKEHMIVSAEFHSKPEIEVIALYNAIAIHSSPISLNLITNAIAKALMGDEYSLSVGNWPLESINSNTSPQEYSEMKVGVLWLIMIPIGCLLIVGSFISFPHIELSTKFFQLQYMCGVKPYFYWIINFLADLMFYLVIVTVMAVIMRMTPFIGTREFCVLLAILFMYGAAGIPFAYLFSRARSASGAFALFVISGIFLGIIPTVITGILMESGDDYYIELGKTLKVVLFIFFPHYGLTYSGVEFSRKAIKNYNMDVMPKMKFLSMCSYNPNPCCAGNTAECEKFKSYWPLLQDNFGLMLAGCVIFLITNILLDCYFLKKFISRLKFAISNTLKRGERKNQGEDEVEGRKINNYNTLDAKNLHKTYSGKQIVKNVGFTLKDGECLGILGVNGAGKTTTFRMLTREEVVDTGFVRIEDKNGFINIDQDEYLEKLGYCPQADALNFVLTGRQILSLIAQLRGVDDPNVVNTFLKIFELEKYADIPCGHYSGGNKRKLSLAVALIGYPKYILLDEPTNGVDPSSRRKFWSLIKNFQEKKKLSFILTSHSMLECEALCSRLNIMKNGQFEKQGTISDLKKDFGGFSIKLKLAKKDKLNEENNSLMTKNIKDIKEFFEEKYGGKIKDEHAGLLHFYIKDRDKKWSALFREVETVREKYPDLIEDYIISEASLEDVFLSVARSDDSNTSPPTEDK